MDPITRQEQYLNAILTGDKSNLPAPITREEQYLYAIAIKGGGGGTDDYEELENLPKINNNVLKGNQTAAELGLASRSSISNVLRDGGMIDCADLVADLLVAANYGKVYITSDTGTTTSNFVDGAGVSISAGDSVEITNVGTTESPVYKFKLNMARGGSSNTFNEDDFDVVSNEVSLKPARRTFVGTRLEWETLTSEQKALYEMVALTDDEDADYKDVYSTSEVKTNKVWIDGKPIYRRVVTVTSDISITKESWNSTGITIANLDRLLYGQTLRKRTNDSAVLDQFYFQYSTQLQVNCATNDTIETDSVFIVEYTKTTD